jgi:DNA helicase HerA-like ATPase
MKKKEKQQREKDKVEAVHEESTEATQETETNVSSEEPVIDDTLEGSEAETEAQVRSAIDRSLIRLGFVNFDSSSSDNTTSNALVSVEHRSNFRRDTYVGIRDTEQNIDFLGRVVEGPFHSPHEVGADSAITRTTVLHPDRTSFRPTYYVEGTIEVLGQLTDGERLIPTPTRPRPYSEIYIFPPERLLRYLDISGEFNIGHLMGYERLPVLADISSRNFLPRNVGIFGTVGSGKSNSTQVIMEEAIQNGWSVIAIDVEGEYVRMNEPTNDPNLIQILRDQFELEPQGVVDFRVYVPQSGHSEAANPLRFKVPVAALDPYVLSDLMELTEAQARLFEQIVERARNVAQQTNRRGVLDDPQTVVTQNREFTLQSLIDGLANMSLVPPQTPDVTINTLRSKLIRLGMSHMLDWNATSTTPELPIDELLVGGRLSVLDVSETDDRSRNIAIAYTLQSLFDRVIETAVGENMPNGNARPRVLVVIEEVHTFVSRANASKMRSIIDNLQIISRRGRKRWMALAIVSQQPGHVPDELFELVNTRFIHQLKSVANLMPVKQTTGGVHEALWSTIPSLGPGQCLLAATIYKNPLFVVVRPAKSRRMLTT